jgi:sugar (pentulose or hexulose) kinase
MGTRPASLPEAGAVIDVGKTHIKLVAVTSDGAALDSTSAANRSGNGVLDVDGAWRWLCDELARFAAKFALTAIVPTTHGCAAAVVGQDRLLCPVIDYEAQPPGEVDHRYDAIRPAFSETCSPRLPAGLNLGRQLFWSQSTKEAAWNRAEAVLTYPQYWSWRLTGKMASEVTSLGCHTDLWCPARAAFSSLVERRGWSSLFPPLQPAWHPSGRVRAGLGLPVDCDVLNGIHDSNASYLRYLAGVPSPFALLSTGTWMICFNSAGALSALDPARDTLANVDVCGRPIACSRFMGGREYATLAGMRGEPVIPTWAAIEAVVARRLFAFPSFSASGGPYPLRRGVLSADPRSAAEAAALAVLYVALMARESILLSGPVSRLYIDGAFAANDVFTGVLAALLPDVDVRVALGTDGTAIGASLLAAMRTNAGRLPQLSVPMRAVPVCGVAIAAYAGEWRDRLEEIQ